ncbi:TonB-dependent receptor [candidate division KSB1 bacterium]|nr:TonB-dependent receptor [candidate division KSB1 bacterium]
MPDKLKIQSYTLLIVVSILIIPSLLNAGATGIFSGKVYDASNNTPLPGATISIEETDISGKTDKHGYFTLVGIPPGIYDAQIQHIGYKTTLCKQLPIKADINTTIDFGMQLQYNSDTKFIEVQAQRLIHRSHVSTTHYVTNINLNQAIPADNVLDSFKYIPGLFQTNFRGGKSSDVIYLLDGIPMMSAYSRDVAFNIPVSAIEEVVVTTGGVSSEYTNSTAGVVNIIRKRGRKQFSVKARTYTDYVGNATKYRDNYRRFEASLGGPMAINFGGPEVQMNYYMSFDFNATDTPQKSDIKKVYNESAAFSNINISALYDFSLSKNNNLAFQGALSRWTNHSLRNDYFPAESALSKQENKHLHGAITYTFTPTRSLIFNLDFSAQKISDTIRDSRLHITSNDESQIAISQDQEDTLWDFDVNEIQYRLQGGISKQFNRYVNLKGGFSTDIYNLELSSNKMFYYQDADTLDQYVPIQSQYYRTPNAFGSYLEAGFDSQHLVAKLGARVDYFNPHSSVVKQTQGEISTLNELSFNDYVFSPRLFIGIPFNDRHQLFFNLGEYSQLPPLIYLYHGTGASTEMAEASYPLLGNPDMQMQTSRNMEIAFQRKVAQNFGASFSLFSRAEKHSLDTGFNSVFDSNQNTIRYMSTAQSKTEGFEVAFSKAITPNLNMLTQFTHQTIKGENNFPEDNYFYFLNTDKFRDATLHKINRSQENIFLIRGTYKYQEKFHLSFFSRFESPRDWIIEGSTQEVAKGQLGWRNYTDLKASINVWAKRYQMGPYIEIRNLLNTRHRDYSEYAFLFGEPLLTQFQDRFGRRIRIGIQIF